ncbi:MAG: GHMP kinase, partial [Spirochaetia bacterium]|nr:GHMP kinase [Spirochaetia bacterium]
MQDTNKDPLLAGSLGAGFSILKGVTTTIEVKKSFDECTVTLNGELSDAPVSHMVRDLFFKELGEKPIPIDIRHTIETPQGAGFGTSGGGALSLVLALNHLYGEPFNTINASRIAHVAEVRCKTGLGTVMGESFGGFRILTKAG